MAPFKTRLYLFDMCGAEVPASSRDFNACLDVPDILSHTSTRDIISSRYWMGLGYSSLTMLYLDFLLRGLVHLLTKLSSGSLRRCIRLLHKCIEMKLWLTNNHGYCTRLRR